MRKHKSLSTCALYTLAAALLLTAPAARGREIESLVFVPREPRPGIALKLEFSLSGDAGQAGTVELTIRTDRNGDRRLQDEETAKSTILFKDNGQGDEEGRPNLVRLTVYQIPQDNPHQEYTAKVIVSQHSRTANVVKPGAQAASANDESGGIWGMLSGVAEKIRRAKKALLERAPSYEPAFVGAPSLYIYTVADQSLQRLAHSDARTYRSPTWSADSKALTFVVTEGSARRLAWMDLERKEEVILTDGPDDRSPHWLPGNSHVVFLRGGRLHLVERVTKKIVALDSPAGVSNILGVLGGTGGTRIIYTTGSAESPDESPVYILELDEGMRPKANSRAIYSPNWFLFGWTSPDGHEVLLWKEGAIYKVPADKVEALPERRLIKDDNKHYEPSWSPDGKRIVFVSTLP